MLKPPRHVSLHAAAYPDGCGDPACRGCKQWVNAETTRLLARWEQLEIELGCIRQRMQVLILNRGPKPKRQKD